MLTTISNLELGYNFYQDISYLTSLHNLTLLIFNNNYISSIDCLNVLPKLSSIQFKRNYTYPIKNFSNLTHLALLNLNSNNQKQLDLLSNINLKSLELNYSILYNRQQIEKIIINKLPMNLSQLKLTGLLSTKFDIELIPITLTRLILPIIYDDDILVQDFIHHY